MKCIILDDEQASVDLLVHYCSRCEYLDVLLASTDPAVVASFIATRSDIDLIFCDIEMPEINGLDLVKELKKNSSVEIVLTTAYKEYALDGFDIHAVDYLLKPFSFVRFMTAINQARQLIGEKGNKDKVQPRPIDYIFIKGGTKGKFDRINIEDIEYIESNGNYATIFHNGKKTLTNQSLKDIMKLLPHEKFMRVHKSFIISKDRIQKIQGYTLRLSNINRDIAIGETYRDDFFSYIRNRSI